MTKWRKSSYTGDGNNCVEVGQGVGIRDSKAPATHLPVSAAAWSAFLRLTSAEVAAPVEQ
ncbi:DUF397 domain-containing protein [Lentzea sp. NPDC058436]|uniref:DUF397 domain-containing protein n=1 Tax=Lentzea sp. NPDC058436 TaxID=3346499 RepID=UPI00365B6C01